MSPAACSAQRRACDRLIAVGLALAYVTVLLATARDLGYTRDEGFYFHAARAYRGWFALLSEDPALALQRSQVDRYWVVNHEHPALMKVLFLLCHQLFYAKLGLLSEPGTAYRLGGMLVSALGVAVLYLWGSRALGRWGGLFAALAFALLPRVFFHAHLACFDLPVAALWLTTAYLYQRSLQTAGWGFAIASGISYGLLLDTKHNAWLLPFALVAHWLVCDGRPALARVLRREWPFPRGLVAMGVLGPLLFFAGWPWIWFDTFSRLAEYVAFHTGHEYYNMEFLGRTYWKPPMPLAYAWLMTFATVPLVLLLLFALGSADAVQALIRRRREHAPNARAVWDPAERANTDLLWLLAVLVNYLPWLSPSTPIFGGTKHWMTAYPFLCLLAGRGFVRLSRELLHLARERGLARRWVRPITGLSLLVGPLAMTAHSHPWGLTFYTPIVGGAPGAASLGLNRTFWGYTTGALSGFLKTHAAPGARVYLHDTAFQSWDMLQRDGRVRRDLRATLTIHGSDIALYHHEPHMARVEHQIWMDYGTTTPSAIGTYDGVPVVWVYERPRRATQPPM